MITVISGTNRPGAATRKVAGRVEDILRSAGEEVELLDLGKLPPEIFDSSVYSNKPSAFEPFQHAVLVADGILTITPEYNGSFPGILKYFVDMLRFPDSLVEKPAAFVGLSSGRWGALRAVEQLEMVFQYRQAHIYGRRVFLPGIGDLLDDRGTISDPEVAKRLREMVEGFAAFCHRLGQK